MTRTILAALLFLTACASEEGANENVPEATTTVADEEPIVATTVSDADPLVVIEATAGVDAGTEYTVPLGSDVRLVLINEDEPDEFHLHGYDLLAMVEAGEEGVIEFVADTAGRFELESHVSGELLLVLLVG